LNFNIIIIDEETNNIIQKFPNIKNQIDKNYDIDSLIESTNKDLNLDKTHSMLNENFENKIIVENKLNPEISIEEKLPDECTKESPIEKPKTNDLTSQENLTSKLLDSKLLELDINISDLIYSINTSEIQNKISNKNEIEDIKEKNLDSFVEMTESYFIQFYRSLINWLLDFEIENEDDFSQRFSIKKPNSEEDLFEKNLISELKKSSLLFEDNLTLKKNDLRKFIKPNNEKFYLIKNPEVIQIIIKFSQITSLKYAFKFLIEINELICLNNFNLFVLSNNDYFFNWLRELTFSAYLIHNKNLDDAKTNNEYFFFNNNNLLNKDIHTIFMLGKKLYIKIILEISSNYDFNEIIKKLNSLFNWAIHLKHFRNLEYEEIELISFIFEIINEIFIGLKEKYDLNLLGFQQSFNNIFNLNLNLLGDQNKDISIERLCTETIKMLKENYFCNSKVAYEEGNKSLYQGIQISNLNLFQNNLNITILNLINLHFIFYEFLTFFNISKNPFVCINSMNCEKKAQPSRKNSYLVPDLLKENNLFKILQIFQQEKCFKEEDNIVNLLNDEEIKFKNLKCDAGSQKSFNKLFSSLNNMNKSLFQIISRIWKDSNFKEIYTRDEEQEKINFINREKIELFTKEFVLDKDNKNCFLNSLSILFIDFSFEDKEFIKNENSESFKNEKFIRILNEENCKKLNLLNEDLKFKIKSILNLKKEDSSNPNLGEKDKVLKTRDNYLRNKKSFFIEFEKILKEINFKKENPIEEIEVTKDDIFNKKRSINKSFSDPNFGKLKSINLLEVINSHIILNLENLQDLYLQLNKLDKNNLKKKVIKQEFLFWIHEYQMYLIYLSYATCNMKSEYNEKYELYNSQVIEIILFAIIYLIDSISSSSNLTSDDDFLYNNFQIVLKNVFTVFLSINKGITEKKRKKSFMSKIISKNSNKDLFNCSIYKIFNEILTNKNEEQVSYLEKNPVLNTIFIEEIMKMDIEDLPKLLIANRVDEVLFNSGFIQKIKNKNFSLDSYLNILASRTKSAENIKPVDLYYIYRNYRTTNFILYNMNKTESIALHKSQSDNIISKVENRQNDKKRFNENNIMNYFSSNNLNKMNINEDEFIKYDNLNRIITDLEKELTKYYFLRKFEDLNLINKLKKIKYKLYSCIGLWKENNTLKYLESNNRIKWKIMNHTTRFFFKPLLKSIVDLSSYLQKNSKFDKNKLFIEEFPNQEELNINFDSNEDIIKIENGIFQLKINLDDNNHEIQFQNYLNKINNGETLKILETNEIFNKNIENNLKLWKNYQKINNISQRLFEFNKLKVNYTDVNIENSSNSLSKTQNILEIIYDLKEFKDIYNIFEICLVKLSTHIKCYLKFTSNGFDIYTNFGNESSNLNGQKTNLDYDNIKDDCCGSFIKLDNQQLLLGKFYRKFTFRKIKYIFKKDYYLLDSAVEISTNNKSYYINFISKEERKKFLRIIKASIPKIRKLKADFINSNNFDSKEIFGVSKNSKENLSFENTFRKNSINSLYISDSKNSSGNNLNINRLNSNDNLNINTRPSTSKYISSSKKVEKIKFKKKKYITIGFENLSFSDEIFSKILKKTKKAKKSTFKNSKEEKECYKSIKINEIIEEWNIKKAFSNFEMLLIINFLSNRSFTDVTQYPVMPWIISNNKTIYLNYIKNLSKKKYQNYNYEKGHERYLRNLSLPIGMQEVIDDINTNSYSQNRKNSYINIYQNTFEDFQLGESDVVPYFYGSMYSNVIYVAYYLIRLFPFSKLAIEFQGGNFDCYARIFKDLTESFYNASHITGDVRELIPEFFFMPEMFININNLNLNRKKNNDNLQFMNKNTNNLKDSYNNFNVNLPAWCENNAYKYISLHKELLESPEISASIGDWMDLIFGFKLSGKNAIEAKNLFFSAAYMINFKNFDCEKLNEDQRILKMKFIEFGLIPRQLLNTKISNKIKYENNESQNKRIYKRFTDNESQKNIKEKFINEKIFSFSELEKFKNDFDYEIKLLKIRYVKENNTLILVFSNNTIFQIIFPCFLDKDVIDFMSIQRKILSENLRYKENYDLESSLFPFSQQIPEFYKENYSVNSEKVIYITKNGKVNFF